MEEKKRRYKTDKTWGNSFVTGHTSKKPDDLKKYLDDTNGEWNDGDKKEG